MESEIPLRYVRLFHVTILSASYRMYGFDYSGDALSVTFHPAVIVEYATTPFTGGMLLGRQVLNNGAKVLVLDGCHRLEAMRRLHVESSVGWIQRHILVRLID